LHKGDDEARICNNELDSTDQICIEKARSMYSNSQNLKSHLTTDVTKTLGVFMLLVDLQSSFNEVCGHCGQRCEDMVYNYETTIEKLHGEY